MTIDPKSLNMKKATIFLSLTGLVVLLMATGAFAKDTPKIVPEKSTTLLLQVPDVRQSTNYSCGVSCFQAVMRYWGGEDLREDQLIKLLNITKEGADPIDLVRGAEKVGFRAEIRKNLTLYDLKKSIERGVPVIVACQAWKYENQSWEDDESGHYMVVIGLDNKNVYLEDPSILGSRGYIPNEEFIKRWHDFGYESPTKDKIRRLIHMGVFIYGDKPAKNPEFMHVD